MTADKSKALLLKQRDELLRVCEITLKFLTTVSSDDFSNGADQPIRELLGRTLDRVAEEDPSLFI